MRIRHESGTVTSIVDPDHGEHAPSDDGWFDVPHELGEKMCRFPGWCDDTGQDAEAVDVDENMELSVANSRIAELEERVAELEAALAKATRTPAKGQRSKRTAEPSESELEAALANEPGDERSE